LGNNGEPIADLPAAGGLCGPGRCWTSRFRFLGDRLRTRFR
jgi:hypothetical protein